MAHIPFLSHQNETDSFRLLNSRIVFNMVISTAVFDGVEQIFLVF